MVTPYATADEHLDDLLERVRLLLARQIVRTWHRMTESRGRINNLFVSLDEAQKVLTGQSPTDALSRSAGLPTLASLDEALASHEAHTFARLSESADTAIRFPVEDLRATFDLTPLQLDVVIAAVALQLDIGLARLATFAWADFTIKRATIGFLAEFVSRDRAQWREALACARPDHVLRRLRVLAFEAPTQTEPEAELRVRVPDRVTAFIAHRAEPRDGHPVGDGYDGLDRRTRWYGSPLSLDDLGHDLPVQRRFLAAVRQATSPDADSPTLILIGPPSVHYGAIVKACLGPGSNVLEIDLTHESDGLSETPERAADNLLTGVREARLQQAIPVVELGNLVDDDRIRPHLLRALADVLHHAGGLLILATRRISGPLSEVLTLPIEVSVQMPDTNHRVALWRRALGDEVAHSEVADPLEAVAHQYALAAEDIRIAARAAQLSSKLRAAALGVRHQPVDISDIKIAVRQRLEHKLGTLAEPFSTTLTWDDLILPEDLLVRLREIVQYGMHMRTVHDVWGFGRINSYGRGLTALFDGLPGTGKTLSAALIAKEMGAELYRVDLSRIVDKYIGETEKSLARVFDEAERSKAVLLFDEADSLFGQRTSIKSSNDRYANLEVSYLLQRMEHFDGTSILTSNFGESIDEAFMRRIKFRLTFRLPDAEGRETLWRRMIPPEAPIADNVQWLKLAREFEMAPATSRTPSCAPPSAPHRTAASSTTSSCARPPASSTASSATSSANSAQANTPCLSAR